jgi:hypothetical protein
MKKENGTDLVISTDSRDSVSEDLQTAIQDLIYRLRELGPIDSGD